MNEKSTIAYFFGPPCMYGLSTMILETIC